MPEDYENGRRVKQKKTPQSLNKNKADLWQIRKGEQIRLAVSTGGEKPPPIADKGVFGTWNLKRVGAGGKRA